MLDKCLEILQYAKRNNIDIKPIKFGKSGADYTMDKSENAVYRGVMSVKYCNAQIADELMELSKNKYSNFIDLLKDIKDKTSVNSKQLAILIKLNFFSDYGKNKYLLNIVDIYDKFASVKVLAKSKMEQLGSSDYLMLKYAEKETKSQWRGIDNDGLINELCGRLKDESLNVVDQVKADIEFLSYTDYVNADMSNDYYIVADYTTYKDSVKPSLVLRRIHNGEEVRCRIKQAAIFKAQPFGQFAVLRVPYITYAFRKKLIDGKWVDTDEREAILEEYEVIKND